jgi:Domain of unknown function (DUF4186)
MSNAPEGTLKPLKISCKSTNCTSDLHCFQLTKKMLQQGPSGRCRDCGVQPVDWSRVHRRDLLDVKYTFEALRYELIRHRFWHIALSQYAIDYARRKGKVALRAATEHHIQKAVGNPDHPVQGRQTPREDKPTANAIHYAQHATASCCRPCLEEWHGIPSDRPLTKEELTYLTDLAMLYIEARIPDLSPNPIYIPRRRRAPQSQPMRADQSPLRIPHAS